MLIEYTIEVPCEPKRRFECEGLWDRLRRLGRILGGESPAPAERAEARQAEFELRPHAFHCARCAANHPGRAFGCFGIVQAPISDYAEEWLADLLPDNLKVRPAGSLDPDQPTETQVAAIRKLAPRLRELGIKGKPADEQRRPQGLLQRRKGIGRRYGFLFRRASISSSQVFEILFCRELLAPEDAELVCRALGVWEDGETAEDGTPQVIFTQPPEAEDDTSITELKQYFLALIHACSLRAGMRVRIFEERPEAAAAAGEAPGAAPPDRPPIPDPSARALEAVPGTG